MMSALLLLLLSTCLSVNNFSTGNLAPIKTFRATFRQQLYVAGTLKKYILYIPCNCFLNNSVGKTLKKCLAGP